MAKKAVILWAVIAFGTYWFGTGEHEFEAPTVRPSASHKASKTQVTNPSPPRSDTKRARSAFIKGNRVAFRAGPGKEYEILDRFDAGRRVEILEVQAKWSRIRDDLTQREGWSANFLITEKQAELERKKTPAFQISASNTKLSDEAIAKKIIARSLSHYPSSCPCPYNRDRGGRKCSKRSAYSRPGGYSPICYESDVTDKMIAAFRGR
ncbi:MULTISPECIES: SH3 domain-containing protein [Alphaproteobacteria]|uniref:SH3 domain-containing protein n=1 Tax=Alphaproteobacteria TaxID=28211 RepID=UPI003266F91E